VSSALFVFVWPFVASLLVLFGFRNKAFAQSLNLSLALIWAVSIYWLWSEGSSVGVFSKTWEPFLDWNWLPSLKSRFAMGVDGLSFPLIVLTGFLSLALGLYSMGKERLDAKYFSLFWILNGSSVASLMAMDLLTFYVFWEFMLIPMYFLIGFWGSKNRVYAALKFFVFTLGGSLALLLGILSLAYVADLPDLMWSTLRANPLPFEGWASLHGLVFLGFLAAFAVKIPVWPVHSWLPDAHTEAPTGASVMLAGVLLKLGVYGLARWTLPIFPGAAEAAAPALVTLACLGIVLGALAAWKQVDIKKMIAYSSVSHLGFMVLGLFVLRPESLAGAMFQNLAHGLATGALFLIFGILYDRFHTRDLAQFGGLASTHKFLAAAFVFASLASVALPGLPGFVGEFLILTGSFIENPIYAFFAMSAVVLSAAYTLALLRRMLFGPVHPYVDKHRFEPNLFERTAVWMFVVALVWLGFQPQLWIELHQVGLNEVVQALR
jgi:NADH-quinone oxidoreductase subunit M